MSTIERDSGAGAYSNRLAREPAQIGQSTVT